MKIRVISKTILTVSLLPQHDIQQEIMAIHTGQQQTMARMYAAMYIKEGKEVHFQVNTGATCNVIKMSAIMGRKYASKLKETKQVFRMLNSTTLKLLGNCTIQLRNPATQAKYKVGFTVIGCDECAK